MHSQPPLEILRQDPDIIAVNKPTGLAVIPGRDHADNLLQILSAELNQKLRVVHRIDKDTSGVVLLARHVEAQRHLSHQFQNNLVRKEYLALVRGAPRENEGLIDAPIGVHPTHPKRMAVLKHRGRPAQTAWRVEQRFRNFTLLRIFPKTGKTHQIRVHLLHIGLPLAIDPIYNHTSTAILLSGFKRGYRAKRDEPERPLIARLTLHAEKLAFTHPDGSAVEIVSPIPRDLRATINALSKFDRG